MPNINSPKVTMADEDLRSILSRSGKDGMLPGRRWTCPDDEMLAAYTEGVLGDMKKTWVEFHLTGCRYCRMVIADVIKAQRKIDLSSPPLELRRKAIGFAGQPRTAAKRWVWVPAGALAAVAVLVVSTVMLRKPEQLILPPARSLAAPLIAKSEPTVAARNPVRNIERKQTSAESLPSVIVPRADSIVRRERLEFGWKPVPHSRYYEIRIVTSDGDLVWEGQTEKSDLQPPTDVAVREGSYFVWITAYLEDGRMAKSPPVKFVVER